MSRGKHGEAAAVRHEVQRLERAVADQKRVIDRLSDENRKLSGAAEERRTYWAAREHELLDMVAAAASPQVEALTVEVGRIRGERDAARSYVREFGKQAEEAASVLGDLLVSTGLDRDAAIERVHEILKLQTGHRIGKPDAVFDMSGTPSMASDGKMVGAGAKLFNRAASGDQAALEEYRRIRNVRAGRPR